MALRHIKQVLRGEIAASRSTYHDEAPGESTVARCLDAQSTDEREGRKGKFSSSPIGGLGGHLRVGKFDRKYMQRKLVYVWEEDD